MSQVGEVVKKFDEFEDSMRTHLGKVDPLLIVDLLLRQKKEKNKNPIYTLEVFIKPKQNTEEILMLKMINDIETVERIRGTYAGGGMASIGPVYE
jgi:hypothetical protein